MNKGHHSSWRAFDLIITKSPLCQDASIIPHRNCMAIGSMKVSPATEFCRKKIALNPECKLAYTWWTKNISHRFSLWEIPVKMDNKRFLSRHSSFVNDIHLLWNIQWFKLRMKKWLAEVYFMGTSPISMIFSGNNLYDATMWKQQKIFLGRDYFRSYRQSKLTKSLYNI